MPPIANDNICYILLRKFKCLTLQRTIDATQNFAEKVYITMSEKTIHVIKFLQKSLNLQKLTKDNSCNLNTLTDLPQTLKGQIMLPRLFLKVTPMDTMTMQVYYSIFSEKV